MKHRVSERFANQTFEGLIFPFRVYPAEPPTFAERVLGRQSEKNKSWVPAEQLKSNEPLGGEPQLILSSPFKAT